MIGGLKCFKYTYSNDIIQGLLLILNKVQVPFSFDFLEPNGKLPLSQQKRNISNMVMAKSVRYSWAKAQNPLPIRIGHLVVTKAVSIIIKRGMAANLVENPNKINKPHTISKLPVKYAQKAG
jgi:hypothetical protein